MPFLCGLHHHPLPSIPWDVHARTRDDDPPVGVRCLRQVTHVGVMVDRHILSDCLVKQKKAFQHRSLPPTLRQVIHAWGGVRGVEGQL